MSLYLANAPTTGLKPLQFFKQRKVNAGATKLQDVLVRGVPHHEQIAYAAYVANLPAFLKATTVGRRILADPKAYFKLGMTPETRALPLGIPPVVVMPNAKGMSKEDFAAWKEQIIGLKEIPNGKSTAYVITEPMRSQISPLFDTCALTAPAVDGAVTIGAIGSYFTAWKIIMSFLSTHTYPAFQVPAGKDDVRYSYASDLQYLYKADDSKVVRKKMRGLDVLESAINAQNDPGRIESLSGDIEFEEFDDEEWQTKAGYTVEMQEERASLYVYSELVNIAKPAPLRPEVNYGSSRSLPNLSGIAVPYFEGMTVSDTMTVPQIIARYFFKNLGDDKEECSDILNSMKTGYNIWGKTPQGRQTAHVLKCIAIALECQARLYVCVDAGLYVGCAILGEQFSVAMHGEVVDVVDAAAMYGSFLEVNAHESCLEKMIALLKECELEDEKKPFPEELDSYKKGYRGLYRLAWFVKQPGPKAKGDEDDIEIDVFGDTGKERMEQLEMAFKGLTFVEKYLKCSPENIIESMKRMSLKAMPPVSAPMYVASATELFRKDETYSILSQFGSTAPSFINRGGQTYKLPGVVVKTTIEGDKTTKEMEAATGAPGDVLLVSQKSLQIAVQDFDEMFKKKIIMQDFKERAKGARNIAYEGKTMENMWNQMNRYVTGPAKGAAERTERVLTAEDKAKAEEKEKKTKKRLRADID